MIVYRCEDSIESIFTAIYLAYEQKRQHSDTFMSLTDDLVLFAEDVEVVPDLQKVRKVMNTLLKRFGEKDYYSLCLALSAPDGEKAQAVYRTIVQGLELKCGYGHLFDNLANDDVNKAFALSRTANRECHHLKGFVRFQELYNGVLYARIGPKNNVLTFMMPHFADRFPMENFLIYDEKRNFFAIHPAGRQWYLLQGDTVQGAFQPEISDCEKSYQELFKHFCRTISIKERKNPQLQRNLLPLRFREYMIEF